MAGSGLDKGLDSLSGGLVVYGTVLRWASDRGDDGRARMWERHYREIERQREQWRELRGQYRGRPMVVAGDFNQDRDSSGWYQTHRGRVC